MAEALNVTKGERYVYTGPHEPWRGRRGVVDRIENPFDGTRESYEIARLWWDDPPDPRMMIAYITPYNIKQWSKLDDASRDDCQVHSPAQQAGRDQGRAR